MPRPPSADPATGPCRARRFSGDDRRHSCRQIGLAQFMDRAQSVVAADDPFAGGHCLRNTIKAMIAGGHRQPTIPPVANMMRERDDRPRSWKDAIRPCARSIRCKRFTGTFF